MCYWHSPTDNTKKCNDTTSDPIHVFRTQPANDHAARGTVGIVGTLLRSLAAELPFRRDEFTYMWVFPQRLSRLAFHGRKGLARKAAIAVQLLEQELGAGDRRLRDREVATGDDALKALGLGQDGRVAERRHGELKELRASVL